MCIEKHGFSESMLLLFTLLGFFMESVLLSVLSVLAALGEVRPLERKSSLVGEARPSGLAVCFLRPLRSVDIYLQQGEQTYILTETAKMNLYKAFTNFFF